MQSIHLSRGETAGPGEPSDPQVVRAGSWFALRDPGRDPDERYGWDGVRAYEVVPVFGALGYAGDIVLTPGGPQWFPGGCAPTALPVEPHRWPDAVAELASLLRR